MSTAKKKPILEMEPTEEGIDEVAALPEVPENATEEVMENPKKAGLTSEQAALYEEWDREVGNFPAPKQVKADNIDHLPKMHIMHYRGHVLRMPGTNPVFSKIVADLKFGGLTGVIFDRTYRGIPNCAIVPDIDTRAMVWIDIVPHPKNPRRRLLRANREIILLDRSQMRKLRERRLAQVKRNQVPDWAFEGPEGEDLE